MTGFDNACNNLNCKTPTAELAEQLNKECFCQTLDRDRLQRLLTTDEGQGALVAGHPELFSNIATFISQAQFDSVKATVAAIERVVALPSFQQTALPNAHSHAQFRFPPAGVFMGYDFHLCITGPKLIEINTNAGGAFLNAVLSGAQIACCSPMVGASYTQPHELADQFFSMFLTEWHLQRGAKPLRRMAIVDQNPAVQFLYPEFKLAQSLFKSRGIETVIVDPRELSYANQVLSYEGLDIDLVYNRLTDFYLTDPLNEALLKAYQDGKVVVTPNPHHHALYADKRHLVTLSDPMALTDLGCPETDIKTLRENVPSTVLVKEDNAKELWARRKELFFKPAFGYGSKATYRGDKLTTKVWQDILQGCYVAQLSVLPNERALRLDNKESTLKMDLRAYSYQGQVQLLAARLYQGQTTNFRTPGGGFAPVFVL